MNLLFLPSEWSKWVDIEALVSSLIILSVGLVCIQILSRVVRRVSHKRLSRQGSMVARKLITYIGYVLLIVLILTQFGIDLSALIGAAGVAGVAIGFAAQTSLSNIISGFFLIGERPFRIGDTIEVEGSTGTVEGIGLLSVTLRTFDNKSVRIPNESMVKQKLINITRHPIRRYNLEVGVAYDEDIDHILEVLKEIAADNTYCLDEPEPLIVFTGFGDSSLNFTLGAWCLRNDFIKLRNSISLDLKKRFDAENIEIPFPHITLAGGKAASSQID